MESVSKKPSDATKNNADANLYKCRMQQALAVLTGNTADYQSLAAAESASETQISVTRCLCNEHSTKKSLRHVSYIRGSPSTTDSKKYCEGSSISVVGEDIELNPKGRLHFDDLDVSDADFYPTDVASDMLQRDQEDHEKESETMADLDCCSCSSWSVCSEKDVSQILLHLDSDSDEPRKKRVSVDEFIRARTEYVGSLSDDPFRQRPYFGSDVVSPLPKDLLSSTPAAKSAVCLLSDDFAKQSISSKTTHTIMQETSSSLPILWNVPLKREALTKESILEEFCFIYGLEIEKKNSAEMTKISCDENAKWSEKKLSDKNDVNFPQKGNESAGSSDWETTLALGSLSMTSQMKESLMSSQNSFASNNSQSLCGEATEFWTVQPQELTIDINSKGVRILLISNSTQDLKFKTKFDGKIINVCPVSGILPAKDQVRMRILVSAFIKRMNENAEDIITVICGKTEKNVIVKVCKGRKTITTVKDRTYICF